MKTLVDSNILVYAFDKSDEKKHNIAKSVIESLCNSNEGVLSVQNLSEFARCSEKSKSNIAYSAIKHYIIQFIKTFQIISYNEKTVIAALQISSDYKIHFFDALLAATMEENSVSEIITENEKDFSKIPWIKVINPFRK